MIMVSLNKVNAQKFGVNIVTSLMANRIEWGTNKYENDLYMDMIKGINRVRDSKSIRGISVRAQGL